VRVTFIGAGDSFGSGGRLQTCILCEGGSTTFLIDCGATVLVGMRALGVDPNRVDTIVLTHLHGDHCAGVPFVLMDAMLGSRRSSALRVVGPPGTAAHLRALHALLFPGSEAMQPRFGFEVIEIAHRVPTTLGALRITAWPAVHTPQTQPMLVRVECEDRTIAYTGDTQWTDDILAAADGADLLVAECYFHTKRVPAHMNWTQLQPQLGRIRAKRMLLTHLSPEMLAHQQDVSVPCAADGMVVEL
jgi:ribonuclease BN (tRNA processing enzyme)